MYVIICFLFILLFVREKSPNYEKHRLDMSRFLETLITHPIASRLVINDIKESQNFVSNKKRVSNMNDTEDKQDAPNIEKSESCVVDNSFDIPSNYPLLLLTDKSSLDVSVTGWRELQNSKRESKIYYEVHVRFRENHWVLQKRFRQFRTLFYLLESQHLFEGVIINYPSKYSLKRTKPSSPTREESFKLTENTVSLNSFIKSCCENLSSLPPALMAFLESDISIRHHGFDLIRNGKSFKYEFVRIAENFMQLKETRLERFEKLVNSSSNASVALNMLEDAISSGNKLFGIFGGGEAQDNGIGGAASSTAPLSGIADSNIDGKIEEDIVDEMDGSRDSIFSKNPEGPKGGRRSLFAMRFSASEDSTEQLLSLPGKALSELLQMLDALCCDRITTCSKSDLQFLPNQYFQIIDSQAKSQVSDSGLPSSETASKGLWISQWRIRNTLVGTSAFSEFGKMVSKLRNINLKEIKENLSDSFKMTFLLNLFNLISVHASILSIWPNVGDRSGRVQWLNSSRYRVGSSTLSLLQIEYGLLRARSKPLDLPSMPGCPEVSRKLCRSLFELV